MPTHRRLLALTLLAILGLPGLLHADHHEKKKSGRDLDPLFGEWKTLFDGKTLEGWQTAKLKQKDGKNLWKAEEGTLTNGGPKMNDICTVEEFGDYELLIDYKIPQGGNSGVYLRGICEIQIFDSYDVADDKLKPQDCGSIYGVGHIPLTNAQKKWGEWNTYRVLHVGHHITVWHNGVLIHDNVWQDKETGSAMKTYPKPGGRKLEAKEQRGPIMLQGDHGHVWYKNIKIRPLFTKKGWKPLWNGEDLSEFTARGSKKAKDGLKWEVDEKVHAFTNNAVGGHGHDIWTQDKFENFAVFYQYKGDKDPENKYKLTDKSGNSGFYLRDQWEIQIHAPPMKPDGTRALPGKHNDGALYSYKQPDRIAHNGVNRWNSLFATCIDGEISVWQNGIQIHDKVVLKTRTDNHGQPTPAKGTVAPFKLQGDHGKVWFTNLKILPLP